jgi:hypothetical protein
VKRVGCKVAIYPEGPWASVSQHRGW